MGATGPGTASAKRIPKGDQAVRDSLWKRLVLTFLGTYAALLLVAGLGQITDPFIHYDDYPALVLDAEAYYEKTLAEGRWFSYLWHLRGIETPAWVNFQLYLVGWSLFVAAAALNVFRTTALRYPLLLSVLVVLSPQTTLISGWFNSLIPGIWLMAAYTVTALFVSPRVGRWLLVPFVPVAIQAYTPYPFLMLAVCLMREDRDRSFAELVRLVLTFIAAFALGLLVIFTINYMVHGVFGVALAEWRDPNPASDLGGYIRNLPKLAESLHWTYLMTGFGQPALALFIAAAFVASLAIIWRADRLEVLSILLGIASGLSLLSLHAVQEGILFPFRSTYFLWFLICIALFRAAWLLRTSTRQRSSAAFAGLVILALLIGSMVRIHHQTLSAWQVETRRIAAQIPQTTGIVYIYGSYLALNGTGQSRAQMPRDFSFRLEHLRGFRTRMCSQAPEDCADITPPFDVAASTATRRIETVGDTTFILLPGFEDDS
ncbi:MAG: hypothetical protein EX266_12375 [Rhodobacteraceae bacterium]|nr:MAG: hypothetical protein EX266_12375 [Paracoccaceae bacterium]